MLKTRIYSNILQIMLAGMLSMHSYSAICQGTPVTDLRGRLCSERPHFKVRSSLPQFYMIGIAPGLSFNVGFTFRWTPELQLVFNK